MPLIDDCLEYLEGKQYFTLLDLRNGFHQVDIEELSKQYTAFVTPFGQYEYNKMPFGLKNAPAVFQRFINRIFRELLASQQIVIYLDDILLASRTLDEHRHLLHQVLTIIRLRGLKLNLEKCRFAETNIDYLGYHVTPHGIQMNKDHLQAITNYPEPTTAKEVTSPSYLKMTHVPPSKN